MPPSRGSPALLVHTVNVVRNIKAASGGEVADAVHQTLHFALDGLEDDWAAQGDDGEEPCGSALASAVASSSSAATPSPPHVRRGFLPNPIPSHAPSRPYISYHHSDSTTLHLPHPAAVPNPLEIDPCGPQNRDAHDVTAKMYLSPLVGEDEDEGAMVEEALQRLRENTGLVTVDTLILAFDGISGKGAEVRREDVERVRRLWKHLSPSPFIQSLAIADVGVSFLSALFPRDSQPSPPRIPSAFRLPRVIALGSSLAAEEKGEAKELMTWGRTFTSEGEDEEPFLAIWSHSDPKTILPGPALQSLLSEFAERLPLPSAAASGSGPVDVKTWQPKWCLRVTVINRDRGLVSGKSYLVKAGPP